MSLPSRSRTVSRTSQFLPVSRQWENLFAAVALHRTGIGDGQLTQQFAGVAVAVPFPAAGDIRVGLEGRHAGGGGEEREHR